MEIVWSMVVGAIVWQMATFFVLFATKQDEEKTLWFALGLCGAAAKLTEIICKKVVKRLYLWWMGNRYVPFTLSHGVWQVYHDTPEEVERLRQEGHGEYFRVWVQPNPSTFGKKWCSLPKTERLKYYKGVL